MLIFHIHHLMREEGVTELAQAVRRGAMERLSPILMTALSAGLALIPLALRSGQPGSEIQTPMAIVILCGLLSSTALNMFVVPALYLRFGSARQAAAGRTVPKELQRARWSRLPEEMAISRRVAIGLVIGIVMILIVAGMVVLIISWIISD